MSGDGLPFASTEKVSPLASTIAALQTDLTPLTGSGAATHGRAPPPPEAPARAEDRYRHVSTLGEGGQGRVLDVVDEQFGRRVALKELLAAARGTDLEKRFVVEAVVTANLEHPGILPVYERGRREDGSPYYTMRRASGRSLDEAIAATRTMAERLALVPTVIGVAQTLAFAHEHGVIHRDIKPANVFVGPRGEAFVLDWGIAKVRGVTDSVVPSSKLPTNGGTQAGAIFGTPSFMAPEQARGETAAIDERTDVFCLGALLYVVLTGHAPYEGTSLVAVLARAAAGDVPSIDTMAPRAPAALRAVVRRAMAKEPADRHASAGDLADELRAASSDALLAPSRTSESFSRAAELLGLAIAALAVGAGVLSIQFKELGYGAWFMVGMSALGVVISFLEWRETGRARLADLSFAIAFATFILGFASAAFGEMAALRAAEASLADEAKWRYIVTAGTRETLGNVALGAELATLQLVVWAVVRRAVLRARDARARS